MHVPNFQLSAKSSLFCCAFFLHFYGVLFLWTPYIYLDMAFILQNYGIIEKMLMLIRYSVSKPRSYSWSKSMSTKKKTRID